MIKKLINSQKDFRIIPFGFVFLYILILVFSEFYLGSYAIVANYFRIYPIPYFVDLDILLCGVDAIRESANPYFVNCYEGEALLTTILMLGEFYLFYLSLHASNLIYIGFGIAILFFSSLYFFVGKLNFKSSILYTLLFLSPAVMLGVERGNCDLIIFLLLMIVPLVHNKSKILSAFILLTTSMLKIFPIGAVHGFFAQYKK